MLGELAEPGVYPFSSQKIPEPISREKLFQAAASGFEPGSGGPDASAPVIRKEALVQVAKGRLRGPHRYNPQRARISGGEATIAGPA